mmetsp:Transcript_14978/g.21649  ORF Transcript_14978/g.21649 Transcript_14978/m.21649 type:complete len:408 (-) Transcript_14978:9-1232(-)
MQSIYQKLTATPHSILSRPIRPSLFVGTRSVISSTAAYLAGGPDHQNDVLQFREIITNAQDGAKIALDWELPTTTTLSSSYSSSSSSTQNSQHTALHGPIHHTVVLILHGINNDASFGYIRAAMRACTDRGWWAVGVNFRGCGGVPLTTPRGYTAAFTGDLRNIVWKITARMADTKNAKLFLVGNSLGANIVTKFLGEEGLHRTLPPQIAGGVSLANPMHIHSKNIVFPWGHILSLGARKGILQNWSTFRRMKEPHYQACIRNALLAPTMADFDKALAPIFIRNSSHPPYQNIIGYHQQHEHQQQQQQQHHHNNGNGNSSRNGRSDDGVEQYWDDASSYRYISSVSVPLLQLTSEDDFLVRSGSTSKLSYSLSNPNVMVVNTRCGGHLGWQECPPSSPTTTTTTTIH